MPKIADIQETPNPNAVKFILKEAVSHGISHSFKTLEDASGDPLARSLFDVGSVVSVFYMDKMITVEKTDEAEWEEILPVLAVPIRAAEATVKKVLTSWGPGMFDAELNLDGKAFRPDGKPAATRIPSAFGKAGQNLHTWEGGWGTVTYWNAFVANLEMHGIGNFFDPRLDDTSKFPIAAAAGFGHTHPYVGEGVLPVPAKSTGMRDRTTEKLRALHLYQLALSAPRPPKGSYDPAAAARGAKVFNGPGKCASCHMGSIGTEPGSNAHKPSEICTDAFQANRGPDGTYVTAPLEGLFTRSKRGFYHDGRFPTLLGVVNHYDSCFKLGLSAQQKGDLVRYLKSR